MSKYDQEMLAAMTQIVSIAGCYRKGELDFNFDTNHVARWIEQFDEAVRLEVLKELSFVLVESYISKSKFIAYLTKVFNALKYDSYPDRCVAWQNMNFLRIQERGNSQADMLSLFDQVFNENCTGLTTLNCSSVSGSYIYLDDFVFTGFRLKRDLEKWIIEQAPNKTKLFVIVYGAYTGAWKNKEDIEKAIVQSGKNIILQFVEGHSFENRRTYSSRSDVLWPSVIPDDINVQKFLSGLGSQPVLRTVLGSIQKSNFSSPGGRELLEKEFLKAGANILERSGNFGPAHKPLGFMGFDSFGFGSVHVTYRNCPNNAPLALWAGDPWYPLFTRKIN